MSDSQEQVDQFYVTSTNLHLVLYLLDGTFEADTHSVIKYAFVLNLLLILLLKVFQDVSIVTIISSRDLSTLILRY